MGAIQKKTVTYDLARQLDEARKVACSTFAEAILASM